MDFATIISILNLVAIFVHVFIFVARATASIVLEASYFNFVLQLALTYGHIYLYIETGVCK